MYGRRQAAYYGEILRLLNMPISYPVISSPFCRAIETVDAQILPYVPVKRGFHFFHIQLLNVFYSFPVSIYLNHRQARSGDCLTHPPALLVRQIQFYFFAHFRIIFF
jgi:hypothetical protein